MKIHSKLPHTGTTIFTVMSALAGEHKALNLSQGFLDYRIDWDDVQRAITSKTRLMILNSPHNPTGAVLSGEDISARNLYGVASIPPSVFYHDNKDHRVLRFCFAKKDETLERAAEKLCAI